MARTTGYLVDAHRWLSQEARFGGLGGDSLAYALTAALGEGHGRWLIVCDQWDRCEHLVSALRFFAPPQLAIEVFAEDDRRAYDGFSPGVSRLSSRARALYRASGGGPVLVVTTAKALLSRVISPQALKSSVMKIAVEDELERDVWLKRLVELGYLSGSRADARGRFAVRGDVVDLWPVNAKAPVRIDFFDEEVEEIRQLHKTKLTPTKRRRKRIVVLPAREEILGASAEEHLKQRLGDLVGELGHGVKKRKSVQEDVAAGVRFTGIEEWLSVLLPTVPPMKWFTDFKTIVVDPDDVKAACRDGWRQIQQRYEWLDEVERPLVPPSHRYVPAPQVQEVLEGGFECFTSTGALGDVDFAAHLPSNLQVRGANLAPIAKTLDGWIQRDIAVMIVVENEHRYHSLQELLGPHGITLSLVGSAAEMKRSKVVVCVGELPSGFVCEESGLVILPAHSLFGRKKVVNSRAHALFRSAVSDLSQLRVGDYVIHKRHGVGRYVGLQTVKVGDHPEDFVQLKYRGEERLALPVDQLDQLSRYMPANSGAKVSLDRIGGVTWERKKGKVRDNLLCMAQELLSVTARREVATREALPAPGKRYLAFEERFEFIETPDQMTAIDKVQEDLSKTVPMDRLICGDVGFGKTEVAMRAAMRVVEAGQQVVVLCPTTVLAYQHAQRFAERFVEDPDVKVGLLCRFVEGKDHRQVLSDLASGELSIVVGTTAVLGSSVRYKHLGLVVVDEEHRFGVKQKERLKAMRSEVHILSLSATPIPRTLQMAMSGIREMSIMATPPDERLSVRTTVARLSETRVRDAILLEMEREGQTYVIHNRIETLELFAETLKEWVPQATFTVAHGQMSPELLEERLVGFIEGRSDVLVCTSIVESGVDLPNVNTLIVHRADRFGLAQLYQLRGRVGRSNRRASCILLTPEEITTEARKRLRVLVENTDLGSGFRIASADLELRGGGNLLGKSQSGHIDRVGYQVWAELLADAVSTARGDLTRKRIEPVIEVAVAAFIPDKLIPEPTERLGWYKRFASVQRASQADSLAEELEGWVGQLPTEVQNLADRGAVRALCKQWGVSSVKAHKIRVTLVLHETHRFTAAQLKRVKEKHSKRFEIDDHRIRVRFTPNEGRRPFRFIRWVFATIANSV